MLAWCTIIVKTKSHWDNDVDKSEKLIEMINTELGTSLFQDGFKLVSTSIEEENVILEYTKAVDTGNG